MSTVVRMDWVPRNEYTTPIQDIPMWRNSGIIKAVTDEREKIQVGKITYEEFDDGQFQYIIVPFWPIIDMLPSKVFQGIPGIDMTLRLEKYYRVNYVPTFITERTPGESREDLWELMESVGLDYYDRLEWLIRTDLRAAIDNLIVERAREEKRIGKAQTSEEFTHFLEDGQYGDEIEVPRIEILGNGSKTCVKTLNRLMHYGIRLHLQQEQIDLDVESYKNWISIFRQMYEMDEAIRKKQQKAGIEEAKEQGKYKGRKRKGTDTQLLEDAIRAFQEKEMSLEEALHLTNLSKSTFYRRIREQNER